MKRFSVIATMLLASSIAFPVAAADAPLETDDEKTFYALGHTLSRNLQGFELTPEEFVLVQRGMQDGVNGKEPLVDPAEYRTQFRELMAQRASKRAGIEKKAGEAYLLKAASEKGAEKSESGLIFKSIKEGSGENPKPTDRVKVHYTGKLLDGNVFDSSVERGQPATFPLNGVIPCWTEGVQKMKPGGKAQLVCPSDIAYGDRGAPPNIKPGATLVFDVELLEIVNPPAPKKPKAPADKPAE